MKVDKTKWEKCKLEDLCTNESSNIVISKVEIGRGNYSLFGASGLIGNINFYQQERPYLGIVKDGSGVGRVAKYPSFTSLVGTMQYILPKENVDIDYLHYLLESLHLDKYVKGAAIPHIYFRHYKLEKTYLPPLSDQQTIATELDSIQTIIDGYKAQLADLDALAQSIFLDMFGDPITNPKGWKKKSLGTLCEVSSAKRVLVKDVVSEGIPFIRGTELAILSKQCFFDKSIFSMFITPEHYDKVKAITGVPEIDDLLIPSINPYGYVWRINTTEPIYFKDGRVIWIHTNHSVYNGDCLRYILVCEILEKYSKLSGAVFAELTLIFLRTLKIIVPPLPLQQQFAERIESIERQKELICQQLIDAEQLMAERMQYYFS